MADFRPYRAHLEETLKPRPHLKAAIDTLRGAKVAVAVAPQLFPTPTSLAARMVALAELKPLDRVLEPSAGTGAIVDAMPAATCTLVEINHALATQLHSKFISRVFCRDFLDLTLDDVMDSHYTKGGFFDKILMNPPFIGGADTKHVEHALTFLIPGGRLVGICANGPRQSAKIKPRCDFWEELEAGTFAGTNVRAALFVINT